MSDIFNVRGKIRTNYNLAHLTWMKVGGDADLFFRPADIEDLISFLRINNKSAKHSITMLGAGSNIIIRDAGIDGAVIKLGNHFSNISIFNDGLLEVGASCLNFNLAHFCKMNSIKGFEFLIGIPGTVGGGVVMNAGSYGMEFKDIIAQVEGVDYTGNIKIIKSEDIKFSYRKTNIPKDFIITKLLMLANKGIYDEINFNMTEISKRRQSSQPITEKTTGSTFVNPEHIKAWELIDACGMRGAEIGGATMSKMHCNFMINKNNASAHDLESLGELVKKTVKDRTGVDLRWEVKLVGRKKYLVNMEDIIR